MNAPPLFKTEACYLDTEGLVAAVVVGMLEWGSREPYCRPEIAPAFRKLTSPGVDGGPRRCDVMW